MTDVFQEEINVSQVFAQKREFVPLPLKPRCRCQTQCNRKDCGVGFISMTENDSRLDIVFLTSDNGSIKYPLVCPDLNAEKIYALHAMQYGHEGFEPKILLLLIFSKRQQITEYENNLDQENEDSEGVLPNAYFSDEDPQKNYVNFVAFTFSQDLNDYEKISNDWSNESQKDAKWVFLKNSGTDLYLVSYWTGIDKEISSCLTWPIKFTADGKITIEEQTDKEAFVVYSHVKTPFIWQSRIYFPVTNSVNKFFIVPFEATNVMIQSSFAFPQNFPDCSELQSSLCCHEDHIMWYSNGRFVLLDLTMKQWAHMPVMTADHIPQNDVRLFTVSGSPYDDTLLVYGKCNTKRCKDYHLYRFLIADKITPLTITLLVALCCNEQNQIIHGSNPYRRVILLAKAIQLSSVNKHVMMYTDDETTRIFYDKELQSNRRIEISSLSSLNENIREKKLTGTQIIIVDSFSTFTFDIKKWLWQNYHEKVVIAVDEELETGLDEPRDKFSWQRLKRDSSYGDEPHEFVNDDVYCLSEQKLAQCFPDLLTSKDAETVIISQKKQVPLDERNEKMQEEKSIRECCKSFIDARMGGILIVGLQPFVVYKAMAATKALKIVSKKDRDIEANEKRKADDSERDLVFAHIKYGIFFIELKSAGTSGGALKQALEQAIIRKNKLSTLIRNIFKEKNLSDKNINKVLQNMESICHFAVCLPFAEVPDGHTIKGSAVEKYVRNGDKIVKAEILKAESDNGKNIEIFIIDKQTLEINQNVKKSNLRIFFEKYGTPVSPDEPDEPPDEPDEPPDKPDEPPDEPDEPPDEPDKPPDKPDEPPDEPDKPPDEPDEPPDKPDEPPDEPDEPCDFALFFQQFVAIIATHSQDFPNKYIMHRELLESWVCLLDDKKDSEKITSMEMKEAKMAIIYGAPRSGKTDLLRQFAVNLPRSNKITEYQCNSNCKVTHMRKVIVTTGSNAQLRNIEDHFIQKHMETGFKQKIVVQEKRLDNINDNDDVYFDELAVTESSVWQFIDERSSDKVPGRTIIVFANDYIFGDQRMFSDIKKKLSDIKDVKDKNFILNFRKIATGSLGSIVKEWSNEAPISVNSINPRGNISLVGFEPFNNLQSCLQYVFKEVKNIYEDEVLYFANILPRYAASSLAIITDSPHTSTIIQIYLSSAGIPCGSLLTMYPRINESIVVVDIAENCKSLSWRKVIFVFLNGVEPNPQTRFLSKSRATNEFIYVGLLCNPADQAH